MSIDFKKIKDLRLELEELLKQRPDLRKLQDRIDKALQKAGSNTNNRLIVFKELVDDVMCDFENRLNDLRKK